MEENKETPVEEKKEMTQDEIDRSILQDRTVLAYSTMLAAKNQLADLHNLKDAATERLKTMCPDDHFSAFEARVALLDIDAIGKMDMHDEVSWMKVKEVYTFEDGMMHFSAEPKEDDIKYREMHRDFIVYIRKYNDETAKFEAADAQYKKEIEAIEEKYKDVFTSPDSLGFKSMSDFYRQHFYKLLKDDRLSDKAHAYVQRVVDATEHGISLEVFIDEVHKLIDKRGDASSLLKGYRTNYLTIAQQVDKILRTRFAKYRLHLNFVKFYDVEKRFFPEYEKYNDLFMFVLFRYIKHNYEKFTNDDFLMISEILTQIGYLKHPVEDRPADNAKFIENFHTLMDLITKGKKENITGFDNTPKGGGTIRLGDTM